MMNIWNAICSDLTNEKLRQATEKDYQNKVFTHFYYLLGWYSERIEQQYQLRVGSNVQYVYPDIVFFTNNEKLFVIEMKQPSHIQTKEDIEQLSSYMKLLPVQFGIYIGEYIELYYKPFDCEKPTSVLKIELKADSDKGKTFVELFKRENFDTEQLTIFCKTEIEKQEKQKEINKFINELATEKGKDLLIELLNHKLLNDGYNANTIEKIINEIEISIHRKNQIQQKPIQNIPLIKQAIIVNNKKKHLDQTHYKLNGYGNYGKGRLALAIVKLFVEKNPNLTYYEIVNAIPFGIEKYSEIEKWKEKTNDLSKGTRWFENDIMTSADGINFAFTTQIGRHNIGAIIDFAIAQGYIVEPIK